MGKNRLISLFGRIETSKMTNEVQRKEFSPLMIDPILQFQHSKSGKTCQHWGKKHQVTTHAQKSGFDFLVPSRERVPLSVFLSLFQPRSTSSRARVPLFDRIKSCQDQPSRRTGRETSGIDTERANAQIPLFFPGKTLLIAI